MPKFLALMEVDVDPLAWEAAGYDPLPPNVMEASRQVASWLKDSQFLGPDPVDTDVVRVGLAHIPRHCSHRTNQALGGQHLLTVSCTPDGGLVAEDADGLPLAIRPTTGRPADLFAESVKLLDSALTLIEHQEQP